MLRNLTRDDDDVVFLIRARLQKRARDETIHARRVDAHPSRHRRARGARSPVAAAGSLVVRAATVVVTSLSKRGRNITVATEKESNLACIRVHYE